MLSMAVLVRKGGSGAVWDRAMFLCVQDLDPFPIAHISFMLCAVLPTPSPQQLPCASFFSLPKSVNLQPPSVTLPPPSVPSNRRWIPSNLRLLPCQCRPIRVPKY